MKPMAIVSAAGYDALKADVDLIGRLSGTPKLVEGLEVTLKQMTQGKGLAGLDTKRPWGIVIFPRPGDDPYLPKLIAYGFIPVTDLKELMEVIKANPKLASAITLKGDVYEINGPGRPPFLVQQKGSWAAISIRRDDLANAPADPLPLFGDLPKEYDVAARFLLKNVPEQMLLDGVARLQSAIDGRMLPIPGGAAQLKVAMPLLTQGLNDLDEVELGLRINHDNNKAHFDIKVTAKSGTKLADKFAARKGGKTAFAGVNIPDAAVVMSKTQMLTDDDLAQNKMGLAMFQRMFPQQLQQMGLSEDQINLISKLTEETVDVLRRTLETKKIDGAVAVLLEPESATVVGGVAVADGEKLEKSLQKLADELKKTDPEKAKTFKINSNHYDGLHIHYLAVPTPAPQLVPFFGETTKVVLATSSDRVWFAMGRNAAKTLKKVIDDSKEATDTDAPSAVIRVSVGKIAKFIADTVDSESVKKPAEYLVKELGKTGDKDHVTITTSPVASGMRVRVELEEGAIKALAATGKAVMSIRYSPPRRPVHRL